MKGRTLELLHIKDIIKYEYCRLAKIMKSHLTSSDALKLEGKYYVEF